MPADHSTLDRPTPAKAESHLEYDKLRDGLSETIGRARRSRQSHFALVEVRSPVSDGIGLLQSSMATPAVYWSGRLSEQSYAGIGARATIRLSRPDALREATTQAAALLGRCVTIAAGTQVPSPRLFAGFGFAHADAEDTVWAGFDDAFLVLPELLLVDGAVGPRAFLTIEIGPDSQIDGVMESCESRVATLIHAVPQDEPSLPAITLDDNDDRSSWTEAVEQVLAQMRVGSLEKVVLARRIALSASRDIPAWPLMRRLREAATGCFHFAFGMPGGSVFAGATPERLFRMEDGMIETDCLAGTTERSADLVEDAALGDALLASAKDRLEHYYVLEDSLRRLGDLCTTMNADTKPRIMKLATLQHLVTTVRGNLRDGVGVDDILAQLHPTPAVGGTPRDPALAAIRALEPHTRGWYAGPVGWIERDRAEFAVAIRSALIRGTQAHVFAGAGIVPGSVADAEWQETQHKAQAFLKAVWG